jgi:putative tricarboxylic transport membrane protein
MSDASSSGGRHVEQARRRHDLLAGSAIAFLGLVLLAGSFLVHNPVPLAVRAGVIVYIAVGIAFASGLLKMQSPQDVIGGMALILVSLTAFVASNDLPGMRGFAFGPGTAPRLFAFALALLAIGVVVSGLLTSGPDVTPYKLRGVFFIIGAILCFAATIRPLGLVIAAFTTMLICAAAADDVKWRESLIVSAVITAFCAVLFPYGLNLPFQLWPRFW